MFRNSFVLLLIAGPFVVYCAWQAWSVSRNDLLVPDPPPDRSASGDQLANGHEKAARWKSEVRKAAAVTLQYRATGPEDGISDSDGAALARAAAKRAAELNDLEQFLSATDDPSYNGSLKSKYVEWHTIRAELARSAKAVDDWFAAGAGPFGSVEEASGSVAAVERLIARYSQESRFSEPVRIAAWRAQARIEAVKGLAAAAEAPYGRALELPLPVAPGHADVRSAAAAPRAIRDHALLLQEELTRAGDAGWILPARVLADAKTATRLADAWTTRERLLTLLTDPEIHTRADASDWLARINTQFDRSATAEERALLRRKVQEFCEAYLPIPVRLDDEVLLEGKRVPRSRIEVKYFPAAGGGSVRVKLSPDADRTVLTEFTVSVKHPGESTLVLSGAAEYYPRQLRPTALSEAAMTYAEARRAVTGASDAPKWTAKSIAELKSQCKPHAAELNKLMAPGPVEIGTRLDSLAKAAGAYRQLFETGQ